MCLRLTNNQYCLSFLTVLGFLQVLLSLPIIVLSFLLLVWTTLGVALEPFWCGFVLLMAGVAGLLVRPTRQACVIFFHVLLNAFSICACFLAAGITGLYGTAVQLPEFQDFLIVQRMSADNSTCIFNADSPLYTQGFRDTFRPVDSLVDSCEDLDQFWTYLVGLMSLSFIGFVVSLIAIFSDCIAPCAEEKYRPQSRTEV